jgi:ribonuclease E
MQGANFAIEKSAAVPVAPQRTQERAVVNMEWGFEGQEAEETAAEPAEEAESEREGGRRGRPRRRRRGRRDERHDRPGGERASFARNGEGEDDQADHAPEEGRVELQEDEPLDEPAGFGEQPSTGHGEDEREERRGRGRRRRGRRGGRRGRDRDMPRQPDDLVAQEGHQNGPNGAAPHDEVRHGTEGEPQAWPEDRSAPEVPRPAESVSAESRHREPEPAPPPMERPWAAADLQGAPIEGASEAPARGSPSPLAEAAPPVREAEPEPEDPTRPARKGWWQRKFSGG